MNKIQVNHFYGEIAYEVEVAKEKRETILNKYPAPVFSQGVSHFNVDDYEVGSQVKDVLLLISEFSVQPTINGGQFLKLSLTNNAGPVGGKMWDRNGSIKKDTQLLEEESIFLVTGKVEQFPKVTGNKTIMIDSLQVYQGEVNAFDLLPSTQINMEDYIVELYTYIEECSEVYRKIGFAALDKYWVEFAMKPAAKGHHHSYLGGLLKHTVGLMRIARYITKIEKNPYQAMMKLLAVAQRQHNKEIWDNVNAEVQKDTRKMVWSGSVDHLNGVFNQFTKFRDEKMDIDALMISILFHDLGKIIEYMHVGEDAVKKFGWVFPYADLSSLENRKAAGIAMDTFGKALGHIPVGVIMFEKIIQELGLNMPIEDIVKISNNLLAHHSKAEWGSPSQANSPEAVVIHYVDYLDSRWESADEVK